MKRNHEEKYEVSNEVLIFYYTAHLPFIFIATNKVDGLQNVSKRSTYIPLFVRRLVGYVLRIS